MYVLAINGSPRKNWNTATLLNKVLEGADSEGASTELIHLYELSYKGCVSCFACKLKDGKSYGCCAYRDDLTPVLEKIAAADAVVLGSPIYFGNVTGEMRSLMERMLFPYLVYDESYTSLVEKKKTVGFIYTMNVPEHKLIECGYDHVIFSNKMVLKKVFGNAETLIATDTYQFSDYGQYVAPVFDAEAKAKRREAVFPVDCEKAFRMGVRLACE